MRVIANNVEYFDLTRDHTPLLSTRDPALTDSPNESPLTRVPNDRGLKDSLWFFDGIHVQCWLEVDVLLQSASTENDLELPQAVSISTDFYPSSIILEKGIILGIDANLVQRRDVNFAFFRLGIRVSITSSFLKNQAKMSPGSTFPASNPSPPSFSFRLCCRLQSLPVLRHPPLFPARPRNPPAHSS